MKIPTHFDSFYEIAFDQNIQSIAAFNSRSFPNFESHITKERLYLEMITSLFGFKENNNIHFQM